MYFLCNNVVCKYKFYWWNNIFFSFLSNEILTLQLYGCFCILYILPFALDIFLLWFVSKNPTIGQNTFAHIVISFLRFYHLTLYEWPILQQVNILLPHSSLYTLRYCIVSRHFKAGIATWIPASENVVFR